MKKNYLFTLFLFLLLSALTYAQEGKVQPKTTETTIDGLSFYPNPVSSGKIYITSKSGEDKDITIFDVLGKQVLNVSTDTTTVNVGNLNAGVYIVKITEEGKTATRKLVIR